MVATIAMIREPTSGAASCAYAAILCTVLHVSSARAYRARVYDPGEHDVQEHGDLRRVAQSGKHLGGGRPADDGGSRRVCLLPDSLNRQLDELHSTRKFSRLPAGKQLQTRASPVTLPIP